MGRLTRRLAETVVLGATTVVLLGHGGDVPTCFTHAPESRTYNVVGTCGPAGVVTVTTDPCSVTLAGDDVGLPTSGNLGATLDQGFDLYGEINDDWKLECYGGRPQAGDVGAGVPRALILRCSRRPGPTNPYPLADPVDWCQAELFPVTPTCDIHACPAVTCTSQEHTAFPASGGCCPTCVANGPNDPLPVPPPPLCHLDTCPQSCPDGQELTTPVDGACCGTCQAPTQACLDGRAQWLSEVQARWSSTRACAVDSDCTITALGSRCASTCNDAITADQLSAFVTWAGARADELCASCNTQGPPSCTTNQPSRAACSNGTCVLMTF